ncbi:MAG: Asp-tRNA(Asn)/Glu-tRNA(Gln) amidotransferase subunit GatB [Phycisphaerales bacterium]|nr:Asp-tRNA(Asn)/Glu-tRNA(Gln) amidotransferase subunit GatB [Phycisphaerales bacterium]
MHKVAQVELVVGLEVHVELATRSKMFSRAPNPAGRGVGVPAHDPAAPRKDRESCKDTSAGTAVPPNTLIDPTVLGLPGALPVMNRAAVEMSMMVGMALGCSIAPLSRWDRKSYFYPDLPKAYQISQYQLPLCFDGAVELGAGDGTLPARRIGIIRAHLEEDAGKLLHEAPGGGRIDHSIVDWNRAGTPLLEIVTQPDFRNADEVVEFAQMLRNICRFLGASEGVMQKGHMRFEPNINCVLTLDDGHTVRTPIVEVKNLNSFKSLRGAIEHERREQPGRWLEDGLTLGPGTKTTRGWDDAAGEGRTFPQRGKEDAHDYRYFPDPDLAPVVVDEAWRERIRAAIPELPAIRRQRYIGEYGLSGKEAAVLVENREVCLYYESTIEACIERGMDRSGAGRRAANMILQSGAKRANERAAGAEPVLVSDLGIRPEQIAGIIRLREDGAITSNTADELFGLLCSPHESEPADADPGEVAARRGLIVVRDDAAVSRWCEQAIAEQPQAAADVRAGKSQAIGRLVGAAMKASAGKGEAGAIRERLMVMLK